VLGLWRGPATAGPRAWHGRCAPRVRATRFRLSWCAKVNVVQLMRSVLCVCIREMIDLILEVREVGCVGSLPPRPVRRGRAFVNCHAHDVRSPFAFCASLSLSLYLSIRQKIRWLGFARHTRRDHLILCVLTPPSPVCEGTSVTPKGLKKRCVLRGSSLCRPVSPP
jgi:hypothetical protein